MTRLPRGLGAALPVPFVSVISGSGFLSFPPPPLPSSQRRLLWPRWAPGGFCSPAPCWAHHGGLPGVAADMAGHNRALGCAAHPCPCPSEPRGAVPHSTAASFTGHHQPFLQLSSQAPAEPFPLELWAHCSPKLQTNPAVWATREGHIQNPADGTAPRPSRAPRGGVSVSQSPARPAPHAGPSRPGCSGLSRCGDSRRARPSRDTRRGGLCGEHTWTKGGHSVARGARGGQGAWGQLGLALGPS